MGLMNMPVFTALTDKMRWHQTRQGLLAENVANAETPGYRGRDLAQYDYADRTAGFSSATVTTSATQPTHFSVSSGEGSAFGAQAARLSLAVREESAFDDRCANGAVHASLGQRPRNPGVEKRGLKARPIHTSHAALERSAG